MANNRWYQGRVLPVVVDSTSLNDVGKNKWWSAGRPLAELPVLSGIHQYFGTTATITGISSSRSRTRARAVTTAFAFGVAAVAVFSPYVQATQTAAEAATVGAPSAKSTQVAVEAAASPGAAYVRLTQHVVETLDGADAASARVSQYVIESLTEFTRSHRWTPRMAFDFGVVAQRVRPIPRRVAGSAVIAFGVSSPYSHPHTYTYSGTSPFTTGVASVRTRTYALRVTTPITFGVEGTYYHSAGAYTYAGQTDFTFGSSSDSYKWPFETRATQVAAEAATSPAASDAQATQAVAESTADYSTVIESATQSAAESAAALIAEVKFTQVAVETADAVDVSTVRLTQHVVEAIDAADVAIARFSQFVVEVLSRYVPDSCVAADEGEDLSVAVGPLIFITWLPGDSTMRPYAQLDLPDPLTYYAGFKAARLLQVSEVRRAIAGPRFDYEASRFDVTLNDNDGTIRALLSTSPTRYWTERHVGLYIVTDAARRAQLPPRLIGFGIVEDAPEFDGVNVVLHVQDFVGSQLWAAGGY